MPICPEITHSESGRAFKMQFLCRAPQRTSNNLSCQARDYFILGIPISSTNLQEAANKIEEYINKDEKCMVTVVNVHSIVLAQNDSVLAAAHHKAVLKTPDGVPLVWIGRLIGRKNVERVYGPDLMMEILKRSEKKGYTNYFFGGKKGVPELLSEKIKIKYPKIKIVGFYSPPFRSMNEEEKNFKTELENLRPDIMWVGLGCPKQEKWMVANIGKLETKIMIGVGAAFDFHAGLLKQAPSLIQKCGLEWLFRLCVEPKRLWRRYLKYNTSFMWKIFKKILNGQLGT